MGAHEELRVGPCTVAELPQLSELLEEVFIRERKGSGAIFDFAPLLYRESNVEQLRVVSRGKEIVGHAGILERPIAWRGQVFRAGFIGGVCAREDLRGQGIGTLAMQDAMRHMGRMGLDFGVLWTGSHGFYERLGWRSAGGLTLLQVPAGERSLPAGIEVMAMEQGPFGIEACHALHVAACRHEVVRTVEETRAVTHKRDVWVAVQGAELVGYAISNGPIIRELEGGPQACVALVGHLAHGQDVQTVLPLHDPRASALETALGAEATRVPLGMCCVVNREQLLSKISAELGRPAEEFRVTPDMSDEQVMRVIFGGPDDDWTGDLPLDIFIDWADHV